MFDPPRIEITDEHRYFTDTGQELIPVTTVLEAYKTDVDFVEIAYQKAYWQIFRELKLKKGSAVPSALVVARQAELLQQWSDKATHGAGHGDHIHDILYRFNSGFGIMDEEAPLIKAVSSTGLFRFSERSYHELRIGSPALGVAGTIDRLDVRSVKEKVVDITDYKTNLTGLSLDSVRIKDDGKVLKLNKYFKPPVDFLEECDYNIYVLQLNIYAYILETFYGVKIGRLALVYISIPQDLAPVDAYLLTAITVYPVPYMRTVAAMILNDNRWRNDYQKIINKKRQKNGLKPLPEIITAAQSPKEEETIEEEKW